MQYIINKEAAKISAFSSKKNDKYEYIISKEMLSSNQRQAIEQAKYTHSPLGKALRKKEKKHKEKQLKNKEKNKLKFQKF